MRPLGGYLLRFHLASDWSVEKTFLRRAAIGQVHDDLGQTGFTVFPVKLQKITAKPQHWLVTTWREISSMSNLQFYRFKTLKFFFLDFGFGRTDMNDILQKKTGSVDQTQLDSASESEKKWANHKQFSSVFVSHAVQKVMLVGCDWWFSTLIFL